MSFEVIFKISCEINTQTTGLRYRYIRFGDENVRWPISGGGNSPASEVSKCLLKETALVGSQRKFSSYELNKFQPYVRDLCKALTLSNVGNPFIFQEITRPLPIRICETRSGKTVHQYHPDNRYKHAYHGHGTEGFVKNKIRKDCRHGRNKEK
jgi:hypothetical protein